MNNFSFNLTTSFLQIILFILLIVLIAGLLFAVLSLFRELKKFRGWKTKLRALVYSSKFYLTLGLLLLVGFVTFYTYQLSNQEVVVISARQFKSLEKEALATYAANGNASWTETGLLLIDIRDNDLYEVEHIKGSGTMTPQKVSRTELPADTDIVIISDNQDLDYVKNISEQIEKDRVDVTPNEANGSIYVVTGGYEALKAEGLPTEAGGYD